MESSGNYQHYNSSGNVNSSDASSSSPQIFIENDAPPAATATVTSSTSSQQQQPPRIPLGQYGGPLSSISETDRTTASSAPTTTTNTNTTNTTNNQNQNRGYYADDDSAISSEVTDDGDDDGDPEIAVLTRADLPLSSIEQQQTDRLAPRNRREWCIVFMAILCIVLLALGLGLGLGFYFMNQGNNNDNDKDDTIERGGGVTSSPTTPNPTYSPTVSHSPIGPSDNVSPQRPAVPINELAAAIQYHVVRQQISDIASFNDLHNSSGGVGGGGATGGDQFGRNGTNDDFGGSNQNDNVDELLSAQQLARDFLVMRDTLPVTVLDEIGEGGDDEGDNGQQQQQGSAAITDDLFDITPTTTTPEDSSSGTSGSSSEIRETRPYITTQTPAYRVAQRFATAVLYYSTLGSNWTTNNRWLEPGVHECDFVGVTCETLPIPDITLEEALTNVDLPTHDDGTVDTINERMITAIDLPENNMMGEIPQELVALPYLSRLGLWSNNIEGDIPSQLGTLSQLTSLLLDDNNLNGNIPSQLGQLDKLRDMSLGYNKNVGGRIPYQLGNLKNLKTLSLSNMGLSGSIPPQLGFLTNLTTLHLDNNRLSRGLPDTLDKLAVLEVLTLNNNDFTGTIPESWARTMTKLKRLQIQDNNLNFNMDDDNLCSLFRDRFIDMEEESSGSGLGGLLEVLEADCLGDDPKVRCSCCTSCN